MHIIMHSKFKPLWNKHKAFHTFFKFMCQNAHNTTAQIAAVTATFIKTANPSELRFAVL